MATVPKDETDELVSTNVLLDTLSDVPLEALIILAVIVLCIVIVSVLIVWVSCKLCDRGCHTRGRAKRSTPATSVYQWDSLVSRRK